MKYYFAFNNDGFARWFRKTNKKFVEFASMFIRYEEGCYGKGLYIGPLCFMLLLTKFKDKDLLK